jgi:uncharacterized protein YndB with AHSA1/START domain
MMTTIIHEQVLNIKRTIPASRERVFDAWTKPEVLQKWFRVAEEWTTEVFECDLHVDGSYRIGMQTASEKKPSIVRGIYKEILPPEKLVFTWSWEGMDNSETLVTVKLHDNGDSTEVELIHERFTDDEYRDKHNEGWQGCLSQLEKLF